MPTRSTDAADWIAGVDNGNTSWMHEVARRFADRTGAWTDPDRYEAYLAEDHR